LWTFIIVHVLGFLTDIETIKDVGIGIMKGVLELGLELEKNSNKLSSIKYYSLKLDLFTSLGPTQRIYILRVVYKIKMKNKSFWSKFLIQI